MSLVDPGDEVLIPTPFWVTYPEQAKLAGAVIKQIPGAVENDFKITPDQLQNALSERSRILVLNSPCNPTGTMYSKEELRDLARVIERHPRLTVFSDEIYDRLVYGSTPFSSISTVLPSMRNRTIIFNGLSKTYAMTGWRVGFTCCPDEKIIRALSSLQGQMTSCIASFILEAIPAALEGPQDCVEQMRQEFSRRGEYMHQRLLAMPGVRCPKPQGAFYVFPDISEAAFGKKDPQGRIIKGASDFAASLLENKGVAVVPGDDFAGSSHIRLSFATSLEEIERGLDRMEQFLDCLR